MKIRPSWVFATLLPLLMFAFSLSARAQEQLPWQGSQNGTQSGDGRAYNEPGETYDPSRHGTRGTQGNQGYSGNQGYTQSPGNSSGQNYTQEGNRGGYDQGYDALRNNGRSAQGNQAQQPYYSNRPGPGYQTRKDYEANRNNNPPRQYDDQGRTEQAHPYQQRVPPQQYGQGGNRDYPSQGYPSQGYQPPAAQGPGQAYAPPSGSRDPYGQNVPPKGPAPSYDDTYSDEEILSAGHHFFGKVTKGLAKVIAHVFKKSGRPNGYILGEEGGGALIAGLRYGEGTVYTKAGDRQPVYWQGPSVGYDFGAEGAKTMILIYNLRHVDQIYKRYAGVDGSAYLVGGVGVTFQKRGNIVLAPIRSGVGVRLGANIGYLKYTRRPTWNPF